MTRIEEIKNRAEKTTVGPWGVNTGHFVVASCGHSNDDDKDYEVCGNGYLMRDGVGDSDAKTDAEFIAHARTDIPYLLSKVEAAEKLAQVSQMVQKAIDSASRMLAEGRCTTGLVQFTLEDSYKALDVALAAYRKTTP
jgi:hypothetical protein